MLSQIAHRVLPLFLCLIPLFFWTLTSNFFNPPKILLLILLVLLLLIGYSVDTIKHHVLTLPRALAVVPLLGIIVVVALNLILVPEGRPEALSDKGLLLLILPLLSLLIMTVKNHSLLTKTITTALLLVATVLSLHTLLQLTYLHSASFLPPYLQSQGFTLTGSFLTTLILILTGGVTAILSLKHTAPRLRPLYLAVATLSTIATVAIVSLMFPGSPLTLKLLSYRETWSIALDAIKSPRSLLLGVGLANFPLLFTAVKPLSVNLTPLWNTLPQTGTSELLTLLATTGLIGFITFALLIISGLKLTRHTSSPLAGAFMVITLALILTPATISLYLLFFVLLALLNPRDPQEIALSSQTARIAGLLILVPSVALLAYSTRPFVADYYLRAAQLALSANNGQAVYQAHQSAIKWYPKLSLSHLSFAEINLNLASALSQNKDLTEEGRATISTLVQQSISEGKNAVTLRPNSSQAWLTLAKIYRNLINVAGGSDKFAIDYYARAVALDRGNPSLHVEYGGLFYQLGLSATEKSDQATYFARAVSEFTTATQLRPTYANAYYNLSKVLEIQGDLQNSYFVMQKVVANLDSDNPEYQSALAQLDALKAKLPKPATPSAPPAQKIESSELSGPSPLPSPLPGGPIDLP